MAMVNVSDPPAAAAGDPTTRLITAPTVVAPGLAAAGVETCLGSASAGLSLMGGGFTIGGTKVDQGCTIRLLARELFAFGFHRAAMALLCQDERVTVAMSESGTPCPTAPVNFARADPIAPLPPPAATADPAPPAVQEADAEPISHQERAWWNRQSAEE